MNTAYAAIIILAFIIILAGIMIFGVHYPWQDKAVKINPIVADDLPYSSMRDEK